MDNKTYLELSARTVSPVKNMPINRVSLDILFMDIVRTGYYADRQKRSYFYLQKNADEKYNENLNLLERDYVRFIQGSSDVKLNDKQLDLYHAILGMQSELAEITHEFMNSITENRDVNDLNFAEESGDMLWYIALKLRALNSDIGTVMRKNIAKLQRRYKDKFTPEEAVDRDLDAELEALKDES